MQLFYKKILRLLPVTIFTLAFLLLTAGAQQVHADDDNCVNCHTDQEKLKGYSNTWTKVYIDLDKYAAEVHGGLECTTCHGGDPTKETPEEACIGIAYKDPAAPEVVLETCGNCHPEIADRHLDSIHVTLNGIRLSLHDFLGEEKGEARFQESCNKCHASCSNCHMEQPGAHGILQPRTESHAFAAESSTNVCIACHDGTGMSYIGDETMDGRVPSSMAEAGLECMTCHNEEAVHGTGVRTTFLSESPKPQCETCHNNPTYLVKVTDGLRLAPQYDSASSAHIDHKDSVSCVACHTQWYENCWNCHQGREERSTINVYLAVNPLTDLVHPVVHSPATSPDWGSIPEEIGGGWAIKSRHSWGESKSCEYCHTDATVYISGIDREAPFVGVWGDTRANATFVKESTVQLALIDSMALVESAHKEVTCLECHASLDDTSCEDCHTQTEKSGTTLLPDYADWSRTNYMIARDNLRSIKSLLDQIEELGVRDRGWSGRWVSLRESYLQVSNDFHKDPGGAQIAMLDIAGQVDSLQAEINEAALKANDKNNWTQAYTTFGLGIIGAVVLGFATIKPIRRKDEENPKCEKTS